MPRTYLLPGSKNHQIGPILGVDGNTGAGGANVWTHSLLKQILTGSNFALNVLPSGMDMRMSVRRNVRVLEHAGAPIEDIGIIPDIQYSVTRRDLLEQNADLLKKACDILAGMPARQLDAQAVKQNNSLRVELTSVGISRIDIYGDGRPIHSQDITDGKTTLDINNIESNMKLVEIKGLKENKVVGIRKIFL